MKLNKINTIIFILVASLIGVVNLTADDEIRNDDNWDLINHYWYIRQDLSAGVERRNAEYIRKAIQAGINVNDRIYKDRDFKALHQAASRLYPEGVKLLLDAGADVNALDNHGYTPLMWAIVTKWYQTGNHERDRFEVIKLLLDANADVNAQDNLGYTPLSLALSHDWFLKTKNHERDRFEVIKLLLNHENIDRENPIFKSSMQKAFYSAVEELLPEYVKLFLDAGADVNALDNRGYTPLMCAIVTRSDGTANQERDRFEVIKLLLNHENIDRENPIFKSSIQKAFYLTIKELRPEYVKLFLDAGADVNAQDERGYTPLMWAIVTRSDGTANQERDRFEVISLLLNHPDIDLNRRSKITHRGATAIEFSQDNPRVFRLITAIIAIKSRHPKFGDLYQAIISNDLDKVIEIVELSLNTFGYWGSCTPNKKLALQLAQDFKADEIYNYLCAAWNIPADDDSWKSTALNIMDWLCYLHPDTV